MTQTVVSLEFKDNFAFVSINNPPVNATSKAVRKGLEEAIKTIVSSSAKAAIIQCEGRTFVAGGDITEFDKPPLEPQLPDICNAIEASPIPFIAAMHGTVLGGGFEIALACAWRIALKETKFGLPEVNIGLLPGAGGTQRLPRLVGVENAVDIACSGNMFSAQTMFEMGALDQIVENLDEAVVAFLDKRSQPPTIVSKRKVTSPGSDWFENKRAELIKKFKGQQSPLHALDALEWSTKTNCADGLKQERERFMELKTSAESKALRHAFFAERKAAKPDTIKDAAALPVERIAVVGGGLMGAGIAVSCLSAGYQVQMIERDDDAAKAGAERVQHLLDGAVARGKLDEQQKVTQLEAFQCGANYASAKDADLAIEAVFEDLNVKREVFSNLAQHMRGDAIFATNTSYIDPVAIFEGIANQNRCLGLHFFSPAHIMKLVEIVQTPETSNEVLASGFAFAKRLRKISALSGICDGFIGNRMLAAYRRQGDYLLADGALPHEIDGAMREFGMPMGPYELQDLTGLQIAWANRKRQASTRNPNERYVTIGDQLCEMDRLGQRSGEGWYRYEEGSRKPIRDEAVEKLIVDYSKNQFITRQAFDVETIQNRMIAALANEGALIVEEGIAQSLSDVDVVKLHGYGFPRWRGGPMHFIEQAGVEKFAQNMRANLEQSPQSWTLSKWFQTT